MSSRHLRLASEWRDWLRDEARWERVLLELQFLLPAVRPAHGLEDE